MLLQGIRAVHRMGLFELNTGHISVRDEPGSILVLGHLHGAGDVAGFDAVGPDDLVRVDLSTLACSGRRDPPEEIYLHTEIYRARPDVCAIVHTHAEHPLALSVVDVPVLPVHHHGAIFAPFVPIFDDHRQIDGEEIGRRLAAALRDRPAIVLRTHGTVTVGAGVEEAVAVTFTLDRCARRQLLASTAGTPRPIELAPGERRVLPPNSVRNIWHAFAQGG